MRFLDHTQLYTLQWVGILWTSDQPVADVYLAAHNTHKRQLSMPPPGFEPAIPINQRPWTHGLDCAAIVMG
jgi:hypothetical protein